MVASWRGSELAGAGSRPGGRRRELPFAFELDGVLFRGRFDLFHRDGDGCALVVDYKTNMLGERDPGPAGRASRTRRQVAIYALAVLTPGREQVEVAYAFLDRPGADLVGAVRGADADRLEEQLRGWMRESRRRRAAVRARCPGRGAPIARRSTCSAPGPSWSTE